MRNWPLLTREPTLVTSAKWPANRQASYNACSIGRQLMQLKIDKSRLPLLLQPVLLGSDTEASVHRVPVQPHFPSHVRQSVFLYIVSRSERRQCLSIGPYSQCGSIGTTASGEITNRVWTPINRKHCPATTPTITERAFIVSMRRVESVVRSYSRKPPSNSEFRPQGVADCDSTVPTSRHPFHQLRPRADSARI